MRRTTRSQTRQTPHSTAPALPPTIHLKTTPTQPPSLLPATFTPKLTSLPPASTTLLTYKRTLLRAKTTQTHLHRSLPNPSPPALTTALTATLVFAQQEAGTAICISPQGLLLTCSHCIADDAATALATPSPHWLVFATGEVVTAECVAWDGRRDFALLRITGAEAAADGAGHEAATRRTFAYAALSASRTLRVGTELLCIGHPGSEDLEVEEAGVATGYDVLHVSEGAYRGLSPGQDPQDNDEIGALMHDCWTYWGHSGAPLIERGAGGLVGLHSSWDEETGMRRGVAQEAIREFLVEHTNLEG